MYMSRRSDKGYSAAGVRPPQLDYFKMYFFFIKCHDIFHKLRFDVSRRISIIIICIYAQTIAIITYYTYFLWQTVAIIQLISYQL